jgi:tetratricopeptide repeat protein 8
MPLLQCQGDDLFFRLHLNASSRPGTSLSTPQVNGRGSTGFDQGVRPVSQSGRPVTGFARPSSSRPMSGSNNVRDVLQSSRRSGTARPMTTLGREMRLGTASLSSSTGGPMVDVEKLNVSKYATRTGLAMAITDYLLYVEHNTRKALELCAEATKAVWPPFPHLSSFDDGLSLG